MSDAKKDTTVIFSTHILSDVERICDNIAFLHNGSIAMQGSLEEVKGVRKGNTLELDFYNAEDAVKFGELYSGGSFEVNVRLRYEIQTEADVKRIMKLLSDNDIALLRLEMLVPNLEDLFMEVVGR